MPPNSQDSGAGASSAALMGTKKDIKSLAENEIAIDGVVYTLDNFVHPGGDSIKLFGGNDVSVQYRMIHPFHSAGVLKKLTAVGVTSKQTDYTFGSEFEKDLKAAVAEIVKPNQRFATTGFWFRCIMYISLYFTLLASYVYYGSSWQLCVALGVAQAFIELLGFGADLIGGSKYLWLQQHWTHHAFTNDVSKDPDASAIHAFQHFYMLPILSLYWISSILNPTCITVTHVACKDAGLRFENSYLRSKRPVTWALRAFYVLCTCVSPLFHHGWDTALLHIWLLSSVESLALAIPFALSHNFEGSDRFPVGSPGQKQPVDWYKSQVETSSTYGGFIAGCLTGGLNCQIEHHLFPRMSSAWYPYIRKAVMEVCKRHGVRYTYYPSLLSNWSSTLKYIAAAGRGVPSEAREKRE